MITINLGKYLLTYISTHVLIIAFIPKVPFNLTIGDLLLLKTTYKNMIHLSHFQGYKNRFDDVISYQ